MLSLTTMLQLQVLSTKDAAVAFNDNAIDADVVLMTLLQVQILHLTTMLQVQMLSLTTMLQLQVLPTKDAAVAFNDNATDADVFNDTTKYAEFDF
jgi:hypothetical protein